MLITRVFKGSLAEKIGLQAGNVLLSVDGSDIHDFKELAGALSRLRADKNAVVKIMKFAKTTDELISILSDRLHDPEYRKFAAFVLAGLYVSGEFGDAKRKTSVCLFKLSSEIESSNYGVELGIL